MTKKILMLTTAVLLAFSMTACNNESTNNTEVVNTTAEATETSTEANVEPAETTEQTVAETTTVETTETPETTEAPEKTEATEPVTEPTEIDISSVIRKDLENYRWEMLEIDYGYMLEDKSLYEDDAEAAEELALYQQMTMEERIMYVVTDLDKLSYALNRESDNTWVISFYIEMLTESLEPALYEVRTENSLEFYYGEDAETAEKAMFNIVCGYNLGYDVETGEEYIESYPTGEYTVKVLVERSTGKVYPYEFVVETKDVNEPNECHEWSETGAWFIDYINRYMIEEREISYYK